MKNISKHKYTQKNDYMEKEETHTHIKKRNYAADKPTEASTLHED